MRMTVVMTRLFTCFIFVLAIQLPISFGFNNNKLFWSLGLGTTTFYFAFVALFFWLFHRGGNLDPKWADRQLIFAVCMSLGLSLKPSVFMGTFTAGVYLSGQRGKWTLKGFLTLKSVLTYCAAWACIVGVQFFTKSATSWTMMLPIVGLIAGEITGLFVGQFLNRCIPPLMHVWREFKRIGPVFGGYGIGYLLISVVFAGCYSSLVRLDSNAIRGMNSAGSFVDYWYFSASILTTIGSDSSPTTSIAKIAVAAEALCGIIWTGVVFSLVLTSAQRSNQNNTIGLASPLVIEPPEHFGIARE
jgi:hypothetical protein